MASATFGSLFSGVGGFDLGLERAGLTPAFQCELDPACRRVLERHWPAVPTYEDVKELSGDGLPAVDVLCGGFPCQDLSVAGRRAGLAGERSGLFHEFMRLADELAPRWVLVENVPGLLSSNDGRDMGIVLGTLGELGYGWAYRVLDAQYFGVAQRRRRVFIVGCLGDAARAAEVLLEPSCCDGNPAPSREAGTGAAADPESRLGAGGAVAFDWQAGDEGGDGRSWIVKQGDYAGSLSTTKVQAVAANGVGTCGPDDNQAQAGHLVPELARCLTANDRYDLDTEDFITYTVHGEHSTAMTGGGDAAVAFEADRARSLDTTGGYATNQGGTVVAFSENQRAEVLETDYARQITAGGGKPGQGYPAVRQGMAVRRLTPTECERLQGFPDGWTAGETDSTRYRQMGNAVCVPVAEWIGQRLLEAAA